jgi:hypothetical protein
VRFAKHDHVVETFAEADYFSTHPLEKWLTRRSSYRAIVYGLPQLIWRDRRRRFDPSCFIVSANNRFPVPDMMHNEPQAFIF